MRHALGSRACAREGSGSTAAGGRGQQSAPPEGSRSPAGQPPWACSACGRSMRQRLFRAPLGGSCLAGPVQIGEDQQFIGDVAGPAPAVWLDARTARGHCFRHLGPTSADLAQKALVLFRNEAVGPRSDGCKGRQSVREVLRAHIPARNRALPLARTILGGDSGLGVVLAEWIAAFGV